jgi:nitrite reductase/ring-hydroxylating ferredoxin subunit
MSEGQISKPARTSVGLQRVALYERVLPVSVDRVWENVLDWEHLPWLHAQAFSDIQLIAEDRDGWSADLVLADNSAARVEVVLQRSQFFYTTSTVEGPGEGGAIVTSLEPRGERTTAIRVEFFLPESPELTALGEEGAAEFGQIYVEIYRGLWDQDEEMMVQRQQRLDERKEQGAELERAARSLVPVDLGPLDELRPRLPMVLEFAGRRVRVVEADDELFAHDVVCPHRLGPLDDVPVVDGSVTCPWHGYRFDLRSGERVSEGAGACGRLPITAIVMISDDGCVSLQAPS